MLGGIESTTDVGDNAEYLINDVTLWSPGDVLINSTEEKLAQVYRDLEQQQQQQLHRVRIVIRQWWYLLIQDIC